MVNITVEGNNVHLQTQNEGLSDVVRAAIVGVEAIAASVEQNTGGRISEGETLRIISKMLAEIADKGPIGYVAFDLKRRGDKK